MKNHRNSRRDRSISAYALVEAVFEPRRLNDLKPGVKNAIGRLGVFEGLWTIDHGPYAGQMAMRVPKDWGLEWIWAPLEDLRVRRVVRPGI